jgi:Primase X
MWLNLLQIKHFRSISAESKSGSERASHISKKHQGGFFLTVGSMEQSTKGTIHREVPEVDEGLDYILSHFEGQRLWPRTISTKTTENRQVVVNSREEALTRFAQASFLDCRISAYPPPSALSNFVGVNLDIAPGVVMIDLDRETFETQRAFEMALSGTLKKIMETMISEPSVIWSGSGYHFYLTLDAFVLESVDIFNNSKFGTSPSQKFLRFAEWFLSNGKCDPQHNRTLSLRNSLLRIPNTINSKNGQMVNIVQQWNGYRHSIKLLLEDFYVHLCHQRLAELKKRRSCKPQRLSKYPDRGRSTICWIEQLLHTPISDYRKLAVWCILAPYLINIKKLSDKESFDTINQWLLRCNKLRRLDFNRHQKIKEGLRSAEKGYNPIGLSKLKEELPALYNHIQSL